MTYRLHSTVDPKGTLYGSQAEAKQAMEQMIQRLEAKAFKRLSYSIHPARDGALMQHSDGSMVNLFIRTGGSDDAREWLSFTLSSAQVAAGEGVDVLNKSQAEFIRARTARYGNVLHAASGRWLRDLLHVSSQIGRASCRERV